LDLREVLPANTLLDGSYLITRVVGTGGFGITYEAEDINLGTSVAIKEFYPLGFAERDSTMSIRPRSDRHEGTFGWGRSSFLEEARTLAKFEHPSIVRVTRVFEANSTAYMVMRFERGRSFEGWLQQLGRRPTQEELDRIVAPLLDALRIMHAASFLHRDIAPDNIVVRADGSPVLLDFGAARRAVAEASRALTGIVKAGYSPLEQYSSDGRLQGPWTDFYALGGTLYRAISGKPPEEATLRLDDDQMPPAEEVGKGNYRPTFLAAIDACLKVRQSERPRSVEALRPLLVDAVNERRIDRFFTPKISSALGARPASGAQAVRVSLPALSAKGWFAVGTAVAVLGGVLASIQFARMQPATRQSPATSQQAATENDPNSAGRASQEAEKRAKEERQAVERRAALEAETRRKAEEERAAVKKRADDEALAKSRAYGQLEQGKTNAANGDHAAAIAAFDEALRLNPKLAEAYWQRGVAYANKGDQTRAIADYDEAIKLDPSLTGAYHARGYAHSTKGQLDQAIVDFTEAIRLDPTRAVSYWQRGISQARKGNQTLAIADYDAAIKSDPKLARAYWSRGNSHEFNEEYDRAIADYDEAIRLEPKLAEAYYGRGFSFGMKGDHVRAIADYSKALEIDPALPAVHWRRGIAYAMTGDYDRAIADHSEAIRLNPKLAAAFWQRGVCYANKGDQGLAIKDYDEALRLDPKLVRAYWDRGNAYATKGDQTRAISDYDAAIRLNPKLAGVYSARGAAYAKKGNRARAQEDFRKAAELDRPDAPNELQTAPGR
jgi:tetratricopeptide (TPR) repeat protein